MALPSHLGTAKGTCILVSHGEQLNRPGLARSLRPARSRKGSLFVTAAFHCWYLRFRTEERGQGMDLPFRALA